MYKPLSLSALMGLCMATSIHAEETFRQHEAHVHGSVEMNVAQDGQDLLIEITTPGMDVAGFEHMPQTEQERQKISQTAKTLEDGNRLFSINRQAQCQLDNAAAHHPAIEMDGDDHDGHPDKHKHEHEHEHEHDNHSEFTVEYRYHCQHISELDSLETDWFKLFPATHAITANVFTDKQQTSVELNAEQSKLKL